VRNGNSRQIFFSVAKISRNSQSRQIFSISYSTRLYQHLSIYNRYSDGLWR